MKETRGDLWSVASPGEAIVITTNGMVRAVGTAVMGRGVAYQATQRDPDVDKRLGQLIRAHGNHVHVIRTGDVTWLSYPVKHNWWENADPALIVQSAEELDRLVTAMDIDVVWMPRPGCGNGKLQWANVRPLIEPILDDRFWVVNP